MINKRFLIDFCKEKLDNETNLLQIQTIINNNVTCKMTIRASKTRTIEIITNNFDDELLGSMPNDSVIHHIQTWNVVPR